MQGWRKVRRGGRSRDRLTRCPLSRALGRGLELARTGFCRRVLRSMILGAAITGLIGPPAVTAELSCARYAVFNKLPSSFQEIASGDLVGGPEIFVLSNGHCTCDNGPTVSRHYNRPAPLGETWSCRHASGDELEVRQR